MTVKKETAKKTENKNIGESNTESKNLLKEESETIKKNTEKYDQDEYVEIPDDFKDQFPNPIRKLTDFSQIQIGKRNRFELTKEEERKLQREGYVVKWPLNKSIGHCLEKGYEFILRKGINGKKEYIKVDAQQSKNGQAEYHVAMKVKQENLDYQRSLVAEETKKRLEGRRTDPGDISKDDSSNPYFRSTGDMYVDKFKIEEDNVLGKKLL